MKGRIRSATAILLLLAIAGTCLFCSKANHGIKARRILLESGIKGGLIVHLGCSDGKLTAALHAGEGYLVHGLSFRDENVSKARSNIRKKGLYGKVSVEKWDKHYLPYTDNLVNLIVAEETGGISEEEMKRVLVPEGILYLKQNDGWEKITKPELQGADEWTHFLHGPDNNAVAQDTLIGPVRYLQWKASPEWTRSHDHMASLTGMVSSGGRVFSIEDRGPVAFVALPAKWELVARDAYNGILLWTKEITPWEYHLRAFRSGPPELTRRLVAIGDILYVTLGYQEPLTALDASTGKVLKTYKGTEGTMEILYEEPVMYLLAGERRSLETVDHDHPKAYPVTPRSRNKRVLAVHSETGDILWEKADASTGEILSTTLCTQDSRLFYENPGEIVCLDASSGEKIWGTDRNISDQRWGWSVPTLVIKDGILYAADREAPPNFRAYNPQEEEKKDRNEVEWIPSAGGGDSPIGRLIAYSALNGKKLWEVPCKEGYNSPVDIFITGDQLWTGNIVRARTDEGIVHGRDPVTGEVVQTRPPDQDFYTIRMGHHRCYRNKATSKYLLTGRDGVEFIDVKTADVIPHHWIRGTCQYGIMPCNGMVYVPPHSCACHIRSKLSGLNALKSDIRSIPVDCTQDEQLYRGPAYDKLKRISNTSDPKATWPTYRYDAGRSGSTGNTIPDQLGVSWQTGLAGELSSPVVAGNKVFVASIEEFTMYALDRLNGKKIWHFTAGGRIDSPPTYHEGLIVFGSADGRVYCLNAENGELVWRFRAAERDHRIVSFDRLESSMPIHGNVLVEHDNVYFAAGISSYLENGIYLYRLKAKTGELISRRIINDRDPETGHQPARLPAGSYLDGALTDILSSDEGSIFMRHRRFSKELEEREPDIPHLYCAIGFLDDSWWHRSYWIYGEQMGEGWGGWSRMGRNVPSGRLLVKDGNDIYGFRRSQYGLHGSHVGLDASITHGYREGSDSPETTYQLFCATLSGGEEKWNYPWVQQAPLLARAMVKARNKLCVAGIPDAQKIEKWSEAIKGKGEGLLSLVSSANGEKIVLYKIESPPVWNGMAVAGGSIYLSLTNGSVICLSGMDEHS